MTQILPTEFAKHPFRRSGRVQQHLACCLEVLMVLAIWVFASFASAQATGLSPIREKQDKQATPLVVAPVQQPAHPVAPIYERTVPEQTLPEPPEVAWDGKQLTIDAENSRLADILLAVRTKTGALVEFPGGGACLERVAVHLGPAPVREVLSSLLYGSDFDYVIQAADDDEDGLRSVVITLRGKGDDVVGASAPVVAADAAKTPGMRLMRGYAAPGKPAFQAEAEAALAAKQADADGAVATDSATATDAAVPTPGQGAADSGAESAAAGSPSATSSADRSTVTVSDIPPATSASATSASSSGDSSGEPSDTAQKVQNMMNMFEQRRQIQARQNQSPTPPAVN